MAKKRQPRSAKSAAAKKGWETRRQNQREAEKRARVRSKASKKAWVTRREKAFVAAGMHPRSARDWSTLDARQQEKLDFATNNLLPGLYGFFRGPDRVRYIQQFIEDDQGAKFKRLVRHLVKTTEFSAEQIRTAFFSPKALKV